MRRTLAVFLVVGAFAVVGGAQQSNKQIGDAVIGMTKAQWAAGMEKNVAGSMKDVADDYTEFNGEYATRIDGKEAAMRLAEADTKASSGSDVASEMLNPKVQVYNDDVAILTYNFAGISKDKDGKTVPTRAKSTRVFVKQGGQWKLVHANFGADPLPK